MNLTRRDFIQHAGTGVLCTAAAGAMPLHWAEASSLSRQATPSLIVIYLRGGADMLSAIVPYADQQYPGLRPSLALSKPEAKNDRAVLPLDGQFGFNPQMRDLHSLYTKGMCVPILNVGSPHPTRSHFDAQDFMERGAPGQRHVMTGWLNRYLMDTKTSRDSSLRALALQPLLPRSLRGEYPVLARPDQKSSFAMDVYGRLYPKQSSSTRSTTQSAAAQNKQQIEEYGAKTISQLRELNAILDQPTPGKVNYPDHPFGRQMRDLAKVIKANRGLEVSALDYNGWDHHINEGPIDGQMGKMLHALSSGISAFVEDMGTHMNHVLVLVMSEFGRTVKENGNQGTDHGHGGFMIAIGGRVQGGKVYGQWLGLNANQLYQGRDLPVTTDFRVVFAEVLQAMFRYDGLAKGLFPQYASNPSPLQFLRSAG